MDFDALEGHGVERGVIQVWKEGLGKALLPVQERAVKAGLLTGRNLIVFAPTSSGKTAVGEMAAVKAAKEGKRVFYLVPLKALAEEKYREFHGRYGPLGIEVVVSSRDHAEFDQEILGERYRLAIATFEKLAALLVAKPALVESVGLVVVDELQMIADPERGGTLEILLTKLRLAKPPPQIVGLSAVLERCEPLAAWLGAQLVSETARPVELRKGVLLGGAFHYVEHNSGRAGVEKLFEWSPTGTASRDARPELAYLAVRHLVERDKEPTIVFVPDRKGAVLHARRSASILSLPQATQALEELKDLEDCEAREVLGELLANGIAFHHADLPVAYRELVERHFRKGGIRVVFSTTTLAMGMNLPARNVVILPHRWRRDRRYGWVSEPISKMEFENLAGRAARLGYGDPYGRAMIPETSPFEKEILFDRYIRSPFETLAPALKDGRLEEHLLSLFAADLIETEEEILGFLRATFSGAGLFDRAKEALVRLLDGRLIEVTEERATVTAIGRAVAARGLRSESGAQLASWARGHRGGSDLEVLIALARTTDGEEFYIALSKREHFDHKYEILLRARLPGHEILKTEHALEYEACQAVKKALVLAAWIEEAPLREIEETHAIWSGSVERLGEDFAWLVEAFADVAACEQWDAQAQEGLRKLARRLRSGVREELLPVAPARARYVGRGSLRKLWQAGYRTMESLRAASMESLAEVLPRRAAQSLYDHLHEKVVAVEFSVPKPSFEGPRLALVGEPRSRARVTVLVDGVERLVSRRHFEILLALSRKEWLPLSELGGDMDTARKEVLRLRGRIARLLGLPPAGVLESDGRKRYRVLIPLVVKRKLVRKHQPDLAPPA